MGQLLKFGAKTGAYLVGRAENWPWVKTGAKVGTGAKTVVQDGLVAKNEAEIGARAKIEAEVGVGAKTWDENEPGAQTAQGLIRPRPGWGWICC